MANSPRFLVEIYSPPWPETRVLIRARQIKRDEAMSDLVGELSPDMVLHGIIEAKDVRAAKKRLLGRYAGRGPVISQAGW